MTGSIPVTPVNSECVAAQSSLSAGFVLGCVVTVALAIALVSVFMSVALRTRPERDPEHG